MGQKSQRQFDLTIKVTWCATIASLIGSILLLLMKHPSHHPWLVFSVPLLMFCMIFLPMMYSMRKRYLAGEDQLQSGRAIATWHYGQAEWEKFHHDELRSTRRKSWIAIILSLAAMLLVWLFIPDMQALKHSDHAVPVLCVAGLALPIGIGALFYARCRYRSFVRGPCTIRIGDMGLLLGDQYVAWNLVGCRLSGVSISDSDPQILEFDIATATTRGDNHSIVRVPIPRGREAEAQHVIQTLG